MLLIVRHPTAPLIAFAVAPVRSCAPASRQRLARHEWAVLRCFRLSRDGGAQLPGVVEPNLGKLAHSTSDAGSALLPMAPRSRAGRRLSPGLLRRCVHRDQRGGPARATCGSEWGRFVGMGRVISNPATAHSSTWCRPLAHATLHGSATSMPARSVPSPCPSRRRSARPATFRERTTSVQRQRCAVVSR